MAAEQVRRTILEFVPHMDAGDRTKWTRDQDKRPLSDLGRRQAGALAHELGETDIAAIYASPALRSRQTVEPLANYRGLEVQVLDDLAEKRLGEDRSALAERGIRALEAIRRAAPGGRVVACSHGDLIHSTVALLASRYALPAPESLEHRAQRFTVTFDGELLDIQRVKAGAILP